MTSQAYYNKTKFQNTTHQLSPTLRQSNKPQALPSCQYCKSNKHIIHYGKRRIKAGFVQIYRCTACRKNFTTRILKYAQYPNHIILNAISTYNLGYTLLETINRISKRFKTKISQSALSTWLKRYSDICTFNYLRKKYIINPKDIIISKKFHHQQVYDFKYHTLKTNIAGKNFPTLKNYLKSLQDKCPNKPFQYGPRCSNLRIDIKPTKTTKHNNAPKLAELAKTLAKTTRERHQKVEDFFLINDSATIAIEVPVYIYPDELTKKEQNTYGLNLQEPLSGHIDILQVRWNKVHILDYKPDAKLSDKPAAEQLFLYALALTKRTKIPLNKFTCAYFDDKNYFQFSPF